MRPVPEIHAVHYEAPASWLPAGPAPPASERAELMARLRRAGPAALDDREALAAIAGASCAMSAGLLEAFGSLPEVLAASPAELMRLAPSGAAARLVLARDIARRLLEAPLKRRPVLSSWSAVAAYLRGVLAGVAREQFPKVAGKRQYHLFGEQQLGLGRRAAALRQAVDGDQLRPGGAAAGLVAGGVEGGGGEEGLGAAQLRLGAGEAQVGLLRQVLGGLPPEPALQERQQPAAVGAVERVELGMGGGELQGGVLEREFRLGHGTTSRADEAVTRLARRMLESPTFTEPASPRSRRRRDCGAGPRAALVRGARL